MEYYIGVDLGTSSLKLLLLNVEGKILKTVSEEYAVYFPHYGWSEQNPEDWWRAFVSGMEKLTSDMDKSCIAGIGVAGQMHGLVILDENDRVIRPVILWNDGRTSSQTAYLNEIIGQEKLAEETANIAFAGFTAPKILWVKENEPENFAKIQKIMLPKDYINYRLTGTFATDYSDASGMLLLDVKNKCWSKNMLDICNITEEQLPKLYESYEKIGKVLPSVAEELGLGNNVTVVAGAGDNAAAAIGTGTIEQGMCNISLGTSGTVFIPANEFYNFTNHSIHNFCHSNGKYHLMGCILSAASCNKWFCDEILKIENYSSEQTEITDDCLGRNEVFFLPYLMGERSPINDTDARGAFIGMHLDTKRKDMIQAILEGVAFAVRDNFEVAKALGIELKVSTLCGGGAKSPLWRKILANVLNMDIAIPTSEEGPGMGGAMLAMIGNGKFADAAACANAFVEIKEVIHPDAKLVKLYERQYRKYCMLYPALKAFYKEKEI